MGHGGGGRDMAAPAPAGAPAAMDAMEAGAREGRESMPLPVDPVCGMPVDPGASRAQGLVSEHGGKSWYFCTPECKRAFDANPGAYPPPGR